MNFQPTGTSSVNAVAFNAGSLTSTVLVFDQEADTACAELPLLDVVLSTPACPWHPMMPISIMPIVTASVASPCFNCDLRLRPNVRIRAGNFLRVRDPAEPGLMDRVWTTHASSDLYA